MNDILHRELPGLQKLPYFIQASEAPAFRGEVPTGDRLDCSSSCGHTLIEEYASESYVSVGIKCFKCGRITRTPNLDLGEVFAASTVSFGNKGSFLLGSTVIVKPGVILTCDQEIAREIEATAPTSQEIPLSLTPEGLNVLRAAYTDVTGQDSDKQNEIVARKGPGAIKVFPFAWAVHHVENCLKKGNFDLSHGNTATALMWLHLFCHVVGIWQHHPRFKAVARDLGKPGSFLHTSAQLITAAYLYKVGNRVGLSLEDRHGVPNPDLYIRGVKGRNLFLEIKTPDALRWHGDDQIEATGVESVVRKCVKRSQRQINSSHPGVLIISSSCIFQNFPEIFEASIQKALRSAGRDRKSLAAVIGLSPNHLELINQKDGGRRLISGYHFSLTLNKHYCGENPIDISPAQRRP